MNKKKALILQIRLTIPNYVFKGLHHQFIASAKAVQLAHEIDPDYKVSNMMIYATSYPLTCDLMISLKINRQKSYHELFL